MFPKESVSQTAIIMDKLHFSYITGELGVSCCSYTSVFVFAKRISLTSGNAVASMVITAKVFFLLPVLSERSSFPWPSGRIASKHKLPPLLIGAM